MTAVKTSLCPDGSENKATLHELADKYDVSSERIRQLEKNTMNKMKEKIAI